ncbi:MAG: hypothetical protein C4532_06225 [Candidatus Abyssobacteria bacterium SURF_17]|uniref:N-acetyl sugar amidotransferase n=1 Tax=Candidatus Abyssobacteria bacterium SURF_17 TaxID=2093361 RepID=A0A419F2D0_9BACT|nr:MAG: hypothetical protein C4532_06225 [Candidatus Abyssubacteria bacterium SURF_17]
MRVCTKCVLPETFPGIEFDENGVCNHCRAHKQAEYTASRKTQYREKFERLWAERQASGAYDCLMSYSGGKDSTYTLDLLAREYGARVLAVTVDNGFVSPTAIENIRRVAEAVGVAHLFVKPRFDVLKKVFAACAERQIFPPKTLERASTICTACMAMVKFICLQIAVEKNIPFVVFGWSPGQAPVTSSVFKNNPEMIRKMQETVRKPLEEIAGGEILPYFLQEEHFARPERFPYNINPLAFLEYDEARIHARIEQLGWKKPEDTDPNSTNCLLNSFANTVHRKQFGYNPYAFELAELVRQGTLDRHDALARLSEPEDGEMVHLVKKRLGIEQPQLR